jgi:hypothetical protein
MSFVRCRLREASTWGGFAAALAGLGERLPPPANAWAFTACAVCAGLAVLLRDPGSPDAK